MARTTETTIDVEATTETVEQETVEQVEREVEYLECDVCQRHVEREALENDDAKTTMYALARKRAPHDETTELGPLRLRGVDTIRSAIECYAPDEQREMTQIHSIGNTSLKQDPEYIERLRSIPPSVGLLIASGYGEQFVNAQGMGASPGGVARTSRPVKLLGVELTNTTETNLTIEIDPYNAVTQFGASWTNVNTHDFDGEKHVCEYCWEQLFDD